MIAESKTLSFVVWLCVALASPMMLLGCSSTAQPVAPEVAGPESISHTAATMVFENCNVIRMLDDSVLEQHSVVIADAQIVTIAPTSVVTLSAATVREDCEGRYLLPGLTDAHVHIGDVTELLSYLRYGVTTVFNLGGDYLDLFSGERLEILKIRNAIDGKERVGARVLTSGPTLDGDPPTGPFQTALASDSDARSAVLAQSNAGYDFIKIYDGLSANLLTAIVSQANNSGLPVFGHIPEAVGVESTLDAGLAVIAHAEEFYPAFDGLTSFAEAIPALARRAKAAGVFVIPNTAFIRGLIAQLEDLGTQLQHPDFVYLAPRVRVWWEPRYNYYTNRSNAEEFLRQTRTKYQWLLPLVAAMQSHDVPLLLGSDGGIPVAMPGASAHEELRDLVSAGLSPYAALRTATANIARFAEQYLPQRVPFGTLRVGHRADLVMVENNPLEDISNLRTIAGVMTAGRWYSAARLKTLLAEQTADFQSP